MFRYLGYQWQRRRAVASLNAVARQCEKAVSAAKLARASFDEIESKQVWNSFDWREFQDTIEVIDSQYLMRQAESLDLPMPDTSDKEFWTKSDTTGLRFMSQDGRRTLRAEIRSERKERQEWIGRWIPTAAAILSAIAAWIAALTGCGNSLLKLAGF